MLLVIHNLPSNTRYADVKTLIKDRCGLTELIVDNLVSEGPYKKVTVGLADEGDAAVLIRNINGFCISNQLLYVEDVQKKAPTKPAMIACQQPSASSNQFNQQQFHGQAQQTYQQYYSQQMGALQFQAPPLQQSQVAQPPTFNVPYYMTAQNPKVGNNQQHEVQYPKPQESIGNVLYNRRDSDFDRNRGSGRSRERSRSRDRGMNRERSPRGRSTRWNKSDRNRSCERRDRDRTPPRNYDQYNSDRSYSSKSYQNTFQSKSNQSYGTKKINPWENENPFGNTTFGQSNESFYTSNMQVSPNNEQRESQRFREDYSQFRDSDNPSRRDNSSRNKRIFDTDANKFGPPNKKFGNNQQFSSKSQPGPSGDQYSNRRDNPPNVKGNFPNKSAHTDTYQNRPNKPQVRQTRSQTQMQPRHPQMQSNRFCAMRQPITNNQAKTHIAKPAAVAPPNPKAGADLSVRYEGWRVQASSIIAREIAYNMGMFHQKRDPVLIKLRESVRSRLDEITGGDMTIKLKELLTMYRATFSPEFDPDFYKEVVDSVDEADREEFKAELKERAARKESAIDQFKSELKPKPQPTVKPPEAEPVPQPPKEKLPQPIPLPKYVNSNKKVKHQLKRVQKEFSHESMNTLDTLRESVLQEELDALCELYKEELQTPETEEEKSICTYMGDVVLMDIRKTLDLHIKKRLLDIRTTLGVRVYCQPKRVKRDALADFLRPFGVISLKKSGTNNNMFIAICDRYENFDALCQQGSTVIDISTVTFKPLQILGPPEKGFKKKNYAKGNLGITDDFLIEDEQEDVVEVIDFTEDNIGDDVVVIDDNEENSKHHNKASDEDDVFIIDNNEYTTVVVIDEGGGTVDDKRVTIDKEAIDTSAVDKQLAVHNGVGVDEKKVACDKRLTVDSGEKDETDTVSRIEPLSVSEMRKNELLGDSANITEDDLYDF